MENLRDEYYEEDEMWYRINNLWNKVKKELENLFLFLNLLIFLGNNNNS